MLEAPILLEKVSENREAFVKLRQGKIGASDVGTILGLNKYSTPLDLWMQKTGRKEPIVDNDVLWYGRVHEPIIAQLFARRFGAEVVHVDTVYGIQGCEWFMCSPDYKARMPDGEWRLLECKTVGLGSRKQWSSDEAPLGAQAQLQAQLAVLGVEKGHCCAIVGGSVYDSYFPEFLADSKLMRDYVWPALEKFYQHIVSDTPPDAIEGDVEVLNMLYPNIEEGHPELTDEEMFDAAQMLADYAHNKKMLEQYETANKSIRAKLREMVGEKSQLVLPNGVCKRSSVSVKGYVVADRVDQRFTIRVK